MGDLNYASSKTPISEKRKPIMRRGWFVIGISFCLLIASCFLLDDRLHGNTRIYFYVRAIDENGVPLANADVDVYVSKLKSFGFLLIGPKVEDRFFGVRTDIQGRFQINDVFARHIRITTVYEGNTAYEVKPDTMGSAIIYDYSPFIFRSLPSSPSREVNVVCRRNATYDKGHSR